MADNYHSSDKTDYLSALIGIHIAEEKYNVVMKMVYVFFCVW